MLRIVVELQIVVQLVVGLLIVIGRSHRYHMWSNGGIRKRCNKGSIDPVQEPKSLAFRRPEIYIRYPPLTSLVSLSLSLSLSLNH